MPSLNELPGEVKRERFIKALKKVGFEINQKGGRGSHYKATWPSNQKAFSIPQRLNRQTIYYLVKEIEAKTQITWEDIAAEL